MKCVVHLNRKFNFNIQSFDPYQIARAAHSHELYNVEPQTKVTRSTCAGSQQEQGVDSLFLSEQQLQDPATADVNSFGLTAGNNNDYDNVGDQAHIFSLTEYVENGTDNTIELTERQRQKYQSRMSSNHLYMHLDPLVMGVGGDDSWTSCVHSNHEVHPGKHEFDFSFYVV